MFSPLLLFQDDQQAGDQFVAETLSRLTVSTNAELVVANTDLVVEAIVEKLSIKQKLFTTLDAVSLFYLYN